MGLLERLTGKRFETMPGFLPEIRRAASLRAGLQAPIELETMVRADRPVWAYGMAAIKGVLPSKRGGGLRIGFTQLALPELATTCPYPLPTAHELELLAWGLPLWLAETFYFAPHYTPTALIGLHEGRRAIYTQPWTEVDIARLQEVVPGGLDLLVTGTLAYATCDRRELTLHLWDVAKSRERKVFSVIWDGDNSDRALIDFHDHLRFYLEWSAFPESEGITYRPPAHPTTWMQTLTTAMACYLAEDGRMSRSQIMLPKTMLDQAAENAVTGESASLAWLSLQVRGIRMGLLPGPVAVQMLTTPRVKQVSEVMIAEAAEELARMRAQQDEERDKEQEGDIRLAV